ncbi:MAG: ATP-binding cassette domain-containing protein, partial [Chlorobi bacterium]|nr:ATP-binding cassette domain-containing protein [Chlorobiota bacterium]
MSEYILKTNKLSKRYGDLEALKGINVAVEEGTIVGLLGPNGSGKTTFIRIVNNILEPTDGQVFFYDEPLTR